MPSAKFILYADDANIILTGPNIEDVSNQLDNLTKILPDWVSSNGLALNLKKTKYMIFSRSKPELPCPPKLCGKVIERETETRFLGVIVDEKLTWSKHIQTLKSKMCRYIGIMYKIKNLLPIKARLQIYHSFVQSHLNYCSLVWGFACKSHIDSLFVKQKKGMRAVVPGFINYRYRDGIIPGHTKIHFKEYNILTVHGIIVSNTLIFLHKVRNLPSTLPKSVRVTIAENSPVQGSNHATSKEWLSKYENNIYLKSLFYKGPLLAAENRFSELATAANILNVKLFKNSVKRKLIQIQSDGDTETWSSENFPLFNIVGLRKSARINNTECRFYTLECPPSSL